MQRLYIWGEWLQCLITLLFIKKEVKLVYKNYDELYTITLYYHKLSKIEHVFRVIKSKILKNKWEDNDKNKKT